MIEWIKKLRETEKGKTLFKFILYMIFLVFVLIILFLGGSFEQNSTNTQKKHSTDSTESIESSQKKELTYLEKQNNLLYSDYRFKYEITGERNILFDGVKKEGIIKGYKESEDELIKYEIENGIVYRTLLTTKEEYPSLYEGLDNRLFDLDALFTTLKSTGAVIKTEENYKTYQYSNVYDYNIEVITDETAITEIVIKSDTLEYDFEFEYEKEEF